MKHQSHTHYIRVKHALETIQRSRSSSVKSLTLDELANEVAMSKYHFQRVFSEWVGISPHRFQQFLIRNQAQTLLNEHTVADTALKLGLSGSSRLYDLMVTVKGVTPGEYKRQGLGLEICYGWAASPFGDCFIAQTDKGICKLGFFDDELTKLQLLDELIRDWPLAKIIENQALITETAASTFSVTTSTQSKRLHVFLKGTPFQVQVWEALLKMPEGQLCSYSELAESINKASAVRSVSSAVAKNPIAYLIPCHRVIRKCGAINQYRWGATRKQAMLLRERVQHNLATQAQ